MKNRSNWKKNVFIWLFYAISYGGMIYLINWQMNGDVKIKSWLVNTIVFASLMTILLPIINKKFQKKNK